MDFLLLLLILIIAVHVQSFSILQKKRFRKSQVMCIWCDSKLAPKDSLLERLESSLSPGVIWEIDDSIYNSECWSHNVGWSDMFDQCVWCLSRDDWDELIGGIYFASCCISCQTRETKLLKKETVKNLK